jgi:hypothetical protein
VAGFFVVRSLVDDEQDRLLHARGEEAGVVIASLFAPVVSALPQLASTDVTQPGSHQEFVKQAQSDLQVTQAIGALRYSAGTFRSDGSVGAGLPPGAAVGVDRAALAARAMSSKGEVDGVVATAKGPRLSFALDAAEWARIVARASAHTSSQLADTNRLRPTFREVTRPCATSLSTSRLAVPIATPAACANSDTDSSTPRRSNSAARIRICCSDRKIGAAAGAVVLIYSIIVSNKRERQRPLQRREKETRATRKRREFGGTGRHPPASSIS